MSERALGEFRTTSISSPEKDGFLNGEEKEKILWEYTHKVGDPAGDLRGGYYTLSEEKKDEHYASLVANRDLIKKILFQTDVPHFALLDLEGLVEVYPFKDKSYDPDVEQDRFSKFGISLLLEVKDHITELLHRRIDYAPPAFIAFQAILSRGNTSDRKAAMAFFMENLDILEQMLSKHSPGTYLKYAQKMLEIGSPEDITILSKMLESLLLKAEPKYIPQIISSFFVDGKNSNSLAYVGFRHTKELLKKFNLPEDGVVDAWLDSVPEGAAWLRTAIEENLSAILNIEESIPGSARILNEEFGVTDFGRYPTGMLLKQVRNRDDLSKPYGVVIYPKSDHNGAFYQTSVALRKFVVGLKGQFNIRVVECESKIDLARMLIKMDSKYNPADGSGHKISLGIIGGHGNKDSILFGGKDARHTLHTQDLMGKGVQKTSQFFEDGATIILESCSTGEDQGIGQELSQRLGVKVIAPKVRTNIYNISSEKDINGKFTFDATYLDKDAKNSYIAGIPEVV